MRSVGGNKSSFIKCEMDTQYLERFPSRLKSPLDSHMLQMSAGTWSSQFIPEWPSSQAQEEGTIDMMKTINKIQTLSPPPLSRFTLHRLEKWPSSCTFMKKKPRGRWRDARPRLGIKSNPNTAFAFSSCQQVAHLSYVCFAHPAKPKQPEAALPASFFSFPSCMTLWQQAPHVLHSETNLSCGRETRYDLLWHTPAWMCPSLPEGLRRLFRITSDNRYLGSKTVMARSEHSSPRLVRIYSECIKHESSLAMNTK